jgi:hypothetical protein
MTPCRPLTILALSGGLAWTLVASAQTAPAPEFSPSSGQVAASPQSAGQPTPGDVSTASRTGLAGFELLATIGYGAATEVQDFELRPYALTIGADLGFTWDMGLRLGAGLSYGFGRSTSETYEVRGRELELTPDSQSFSGVVSIGYDLWLHFLILRYSLGLGATWMRWEFGDVEGTVDGYAAPDGSAVSFVFAPGLKLLWPFQALECGVGFDYWMQADADIPSGIVVQALVGTKL